MFATRSRFITSLLITASLLLSGLAYGYGPEDIPPQAKAYLKYQQIFNQRTSDAKTFSALDFTALPPEYDPKNQPVFELGYVEVPENVAKARVGDLSKTLSKAMIVKHGEQTFYRFFIHPDMERSYPKMIKEFGLKKAEFLASPTASPRSLIVWWKEHPERGVFGQKVSLLRKIGGVARLNPTDKLERAYAINNALTAIPENAKKKYGFDFLHEPFVMESTEKAYGNISRDYDLELIHPNGKPHYLPGFALASRGPDGEPSVLENLIRKSGEDPSSYLEKNVLKPLIRAFSYLSFQEGLVGEPHQQNVLFELDEKGELTGKVVLLDLDANKPDLALRHFRGKSDAPFQEVLRPFKYLKLSSGPRYYNDAYNDYVRNDWSFLLDKMLSTAKLRGAKKVVNDHQLWESADKLFLIEATRHLGSQAVLGDLTKFYSRNRDRLEMLYPHVDWANPKLSPEEVDGLLTEFTPSQIFKGKFSRGEAPFEVDEMVGRYKDAAHAARAPEQIDQSTLRSEYVRLSYNYRTSTRKIPPKGTLYELHGGAIEAYDAKGRLIGMGLLEPESLLESSTPFYKDVPFPRQEPNRALLRKLYAKAELAPVTSLEECIQQAISGRPARRARSSTSRPESRGSSIR